MASSTSCSWRATAGTVARRTAAGVRHAASGPLPAREIGLEVDRHRGVVVAQRRGPRRRERVEPRAIGVRDLDVMAPRLSTSCSSVRGPMIGAVMPGCDAFHASASCDGVQPFSLASATSPSITSNAAGVAGRPKLSLPPCQRPAALWSSRRYLPVSSPPHSGAHGISASPNVCAARNHLALGRAIEQVVRHLLADEAVQAELLRRPQRLDALPRRKHARADVAHLALRESDRRARAASRRSECPTAARCS